MLYVSIMHSTHSPSPSKMALADVMSSTDRPESRNDRAEIYRLAEKEGGGITADQTGLRLGRSEVLRSLGHYLRRAQNAAWTRETWIH